MGLSGGAGAAPLRLDFLSTFTVVELSRLCLTSETGTHFLAEDASEFARITVAGDAVRLPHPSLLQVKVTGVDPQLYFPALQIPLETKRIQLTLRLRVRAQGALDS